MKVIIIEDEPLVCEYLISLIAKLSTKLEIVATLDTVTSAVQWFKEKQAPDLAFMDIRLADGLSFEIFERCIVPCPVIFTTAYDEYAVKAFKVNSIDYLLKPISLDALETSLLKFKSIHAKQSTFINQQLLPTIGTEIKTGYKTRFVVKVGEHLRMIPIEQISYFLSQDKATWIGTSDGRQYPIEQFIDAVEDCVDRARYFRINRKYLIAIDAIEDVVVYSGSRLMVKLPHCDTESTIVSRERVVAFRKWMEGGF
jgi:DNA-binding LytR/AlgR family response regulator